MRRHLIALANRFRASRFGIPLAYFLSGCLLGGIGVATYASISPTQDAWPDRTMIRDEDSTYSLVKPLLICTTGYLGEAKEYAELKDALTQEIQLRIDAKQISQASVYFRNLRTGQWVSINGDESYWPASMMKVPVMIALLKQSESDMDLLEKTVTVTADLFPTDPQNIPPEIPLTNGETYTVDELIERMIVYSDNRALNILLAGMDQAYAKEVLHDLGVDYPTEPGQFHISPHTYSYFFRILYNGTYLRKSNSEKALSLLTQTTFDNGLVAGFPDGTVIAHKFGDGTTVEHGVVQAELHNCGVIYDDNDDFILCIMTKGSDPNMLANAVAAISKTAAHALGF